MPSCPFCQTELSDDFGLIDCPGCDASLFIEMDGSVRSTSESASPEPALAAEPPMMEEDFSTHEAEDSPVADPTGDFLEEDQNDFAFEMSEPEPQEEPEPAADLESGMSLDEPPAAMDSVEEPPAKEFEDIYSDPAEPDAPLEVPSPVSDSLESADLSNLATAIDQQGAVEGLRYNLKISGIDTSDLRREVFEALLDKKLGWDTEEVMNSIEAGVLELKSVSAVKAHVVVQRLKVLPLKIRWEQYADA